MRSPTALSGRQPSTSSSLKPWPCPSGGPTASGAWHDVYEQASCLGIAWIAAHRAVGRARATGPGGSVTDSADKYVTSSSAAAQSRTGQGTVSAAELLTLLLGLRPFVKVAHQFPARRQWLWYPGHGT